MPAKKKDSSTRARRNKASTRATLQPKLVVALEDYSRHTVADLRAEIDRRNESRPEGKHLARTGTKPVLIERLTADDDPTPKLPERAADWHQMTREWWADVWASPMSNEWHESDIHNLYVCAMLYDDMWQGETATARQKAAQEFRQQRAVLGLTPYDRRRLEWSIESAEEAKDRGTQRRSAGQPPAPPKGGQPPAVDPRGIHVAK
jgi:hypothetical protein